MKNKPLIISIISLILTVVLSMNYKNNSIKASVVLPESTSVSKSILNLDSSEMRAVWVPFMSLNMKGSDFSENAFKEKFDNIIEESKKHNLNTLIVHVRPFSDALYPSEYFPWSHIVSGTQGKDPGFDPLNYMIKATHNSGLQFHAWINPLRIQTNNTPDSLCESNIFNTLRNSENNPSDIVFDAPSGKYLNPGYPKVRELIINGVLEIVKKYPVDGIQFDDYFYPPEDGDFDSTCYNSYCSTSGNTHPVSLHTWRTANINSLISGTYSAIKSINTNVVFGVSPQCNTDNDLKIGADVFTWCKTPGYVDYICPQTYVSLEHPFLPFSKSVNQWREMVRDNKNIKLYFGLAMYKAGSDADKGTWKNHDDILKTQIEQCRQVGCNGFMLFSFEDFNNEKAYGEIQNVMSVLN